MCPVIHQVWPLADPRLPTFGLQAMPDAVSTASASLHNTAVRQRRHPLRWHLEIPMQNASDPVAIVLAASAFAADKHRDQRRKGQDASPYINHPIAVANVLANEAGITDPVILAAALLHDTIEDTKTTAEELKAAFGPEITGIVVEVTDDKNLEKADRKRLQIEHAGSLSRRAQLVKLADKICNVRDINRSPPVEWSHERRREYFIWAKQVVDQMRGISSDLEQRFDAEYANRAL